MSLIRQRPGMPKIVKIYDEKQKIQLNPNLGITGLAIINGGGDMPLEKTIDYDIEYI